jgi:hypothetical protein
MSGGSFPAPRPVPDPRNGEIFVPTYHNGARGFPLISNINKKYIFFGQNDDSSITFFSFCFEKKNIFS